MSIPAGPRDRYLFWRRVIAFLAGLACVIIGFGVVLATRPIADPLVGWGFVAAGFGLIALAVPL